MKIKIIAIAAFAATALCAVNAHADSYLIESEKFQFTADWVISTKGSNSVLETKGSESSPITVIDIKKAGKYFIWASSADFAQNAPGTRNYSVSVNSKEMPKVAGKHGREGFYWELLGEADLPKGENLLVLKRVNSLPRSDALIITDDPAFDPNAPAFTPQEREKITIKPAEIKGRIVGAFPQRPLISAAKGQSVSIENGETRIVFEPATLENGKPTYLRRAEFLKGDKWIKLPPFKDEMLFIIKDPKPRLKSSLYYCSWGASKAKLVIEAAGQKFELDGAKSNPYAVGQITLLPPQSVVKKDARTVEIKYEGGVRASFALPQKGYAAKFAVEKTVAEDGFYSFGLTGFNALAETDCTATLLAPLYQYCRTMGEPKAVPSGMTSQPLAIVESAFDGGLISWAVAGDTAANPFAWTTSKYPYFALSLSDENARVQPAIFSPVLGEPSSKLKAGAELKASWFFICAPAPWTDLLEYANREIFKTDFLREPYETSLSDAAANMAAFLKDVKNSAWDAELKGRWNIESKLTVSQSSPLAELEVALLTDDEDYYENIALPSIEFTLSRPFCHFGKELPEEDTFLRDFMTFIKVPAGYWDLGYYAGVNRLLGMANPWLKDFYEKPAAPRDDKRFAERKMDWMAKLGVYLAEPSPALLEEIKKGCDDYIAKVLEKPAHGEFREGFSNLPPVIPYWWYMPDMYEITGDAKYLKYAELGAFYSMSTLWAFPMPPNGDITISQGNRTFGVMYEWWLGDKRFRLGLDANKALFNELGKKTQKQNTAEAAAVGGGGDFWILPEKKCDAFKVSQIGLSIEGPATFLSTEGNYRNMMMCSWSPEMLRAGAYSKRDILTLFSRHSIIGRFANFPGYYISDFTDLPHNENYPYAGPDVTSLYYHQAPAFFAQCFDYLVAQAETRGGGKIKFSYVRQQGYVWFTDRIYGGIAGEVFKERAALKIDKDAVRPASSKVSVLLARAEDAVWALLINDGGKEIDVPVFLNPSSRLLKDALTNENVSIRDADGKETASIPFLGDKSVKIPALGLAAIRIPAKKIAVDAPVKPVQNGYVKVPTGVKGWGDLNAFRIRGPFGKDSLYVVFGGKPSRGKAVIKFKSPNAGELSDSSYPYEFTVYPLSFEDKIVFDAEITAADGKTYKIENVSL